MPILVNKYIFTKIPQLAPFFIRPLLNLVFDALNAKMIHPRMKTNAELIDAHLEKAGDWFAGGDGPTTADFMMSFPLEAWSASNFGDLGPNAKAYIERVQARPAYRRALEKGGEYSYAKL